MLPPDPILPAVPGTTVYRFEFRATSKANEQQILEGSVKRPCLGYRLVGDRPFPITLARPIEDDPENFQGCEVILVPNAGNAPSPRRRGRPPSSLNL